MDIDELVREKIRLENDLLEMISCRMQSFREKTGISPSSISVMTIPTRTIGQMHEETLVSRVDVDIRL